MQKHAILSQIAINDEIVVTKTTYSALTGTNLRLVLANMGNIIDIESPFR